MLRKVAILNLNIMIIYDLWQILFVGLLICFFIAVVVAVIVVVVFALCVLSLLNTIL